MTLEHVIVAALLIVVTIAVALDSKARAAWPDNCERYYRQMETSFTSDMKTANGVQYLACREHERSK